LYSAWMLNRLIRPPHAFDRGNHSAVDWINEQRHNVLQQTDRVGWFYPAFKPEPSEEVESSESPLIQAADIAAGIARQIWAREGLCQLVRSFDYVVYNGERQSEQSASSAEKRLLSNN
jgi:hypothetical protein